MCVLDGLWKSAMKLMNSLFVTTNLSSNYVEICLRWDFKSVPLYQKEPCYGTAQYGGANTLEKEERKHENFFIKNK